MTTITGTKGSTTLVSVHDVDGGLNMNEMTRNVVITQDSIDETGSITTAGGLPVLSQDTIATVDFDESEDHDNVNSEDISNKVSQQNVLSVGRGDSEGTTAEHVVLSPPPIIVQCPNVNDVLFPMEGFTMWPGNIYCNNILQQHQSSFIESSDNKERQARIILEIVDMIRSQPPSNENEEDRKLKGGRGRFLKAIQVPNRKNKQDLSLRHTADNLQCHNLENIVGDQMLTKTIWEVMYESDVLIQLSKILLCRTKTSDKDATMADEKKDSTEKEESQISTSSLAILQGLYYVPDYYPTRTEKRPHEYDSNGSCDDGNDDDSAVSYYNSSSDDNDNQAMTMKKRRIIHRTMDDYKPTTSKPSFVSNHNASRTDISSHANPTKKSHHVARTQQPLPTKVSMIGRIMMADEEPHGGSVVPMACTSSTSIKSTTNNNNNNNNNINDNNKVNFQYKPKSMKSHQAMIEQEGSDNLPKGVTVRPSGKWQAQTYFAGQSRYVGVYDTSRLAARAYNVVQDYLRTYRSQRKITKDTPKDELTTVFADARRAADEAVQRLRRDLNMNDAVDEGIVDAPIDTMNPQSSSASPASVNIDTQFTDPHLDRVSTVNTESQPTDSVDESPNHRDFDPTTSARQVDSSTPRN